MREATATKHRCQPTCAPSTRALRFCLELAWPRMTAQRQLRKHSALLEGLLVRARVRACLRVCVCACVLA